MENLLNSGIQFIIWLQGWGSWLTPIMKVFTFLGNQEFYLLIAPAILWCIDSTLGLRLGIFLMINGMFNGLFKMAFHGPRPYWYSNQVQVLTGPENSFGVPSGHAQNAVVVWGTVAQRIKRSWAWAGAIFLMLMIGVSRLYLAVHFPIDVLVGWFAGAVILWLMLILERPVVEWIKKFRAGTQVLITFFFSLVLILITVIIRLYLSGWIVPVEWINNAHLAFPTEPLITPFSFHNVLTTPGAFFGLAAGWILTLLQGGFSTQDAWWKLVLRYFAGLVGVLVLYLGLGSLFPENETFISYALRYIRYALIGFWISGLAPWIFIKVRLATRIKG